LRAFKPLGRTRRAGFDLRTPWRGWLCLYVAGATAIYAAEFAVSLATLMQAVEAGRRKVVVWISPGLSCDWAFGIFEQRGENGADLYAPKARATVIGYVISRLRDGQQLPDITVGNRQHSFALGP
jgi:hypothetical protein